LSGRGAVTLSSFGLVLRHQLGSVVATAIDFSAMVTWVELLHGSPVTGTALGAACGATGNFLLGRRWIFKAERGPMGWQAARYVLVSGGSLALNSLGEWLVLRQFR